MAEIRVEKRKRPLWPWILGILGLLLIAFVVFIQTDDDPENIVASNNTGQYGGAAGGMDKVEIYDDTSNVASSKAEEVTGEACIQRFQSWVHENNATQAEGLNHQFTHDGLKYLSCSLESLLEKNNITDADINQKAEALDQKAEAIQKDQESTQHAQMIKEAFSESVEVLEAIQKKSYPSMKTQISEVRKAANDMEVDNATLEQKGKVNDFFAKTSDVLVQMQENNKK